MPSTGGTATVPSTTKTPLCWLPPTRGGIFLDSIDDPKCFWVGRPWRVSGRNGMHRYNNQDHSMLTAMVAVENILHGVKAKDNIWDVNTEQEYQEEKCQ